MFTFERNKDTSLNYDSQERNVNFYFLILYILQETLSNISKFL